MVQEVFVEEGAAVAAGQLLVNLRHANVLVAQAQAALTLAQLWRCWKPAPSPAEVARRWRRRRWLRRSQLRQAGRRVDARRHRRRRLPAQAQADYRVLTLGADPQEMIEACQS